MNSLLSSNISLKVMPNMESLSRETNQNYHQLKLYKNFNFQNQSHGDYCGIEVNSHIKSYNPENKEKIRVLQRDTLINYQSTNNQDLYQNTTTLSQTLENLGDSTYESQILQQNSQKEFSKSLSHQNSNVYNEANNQKSDKSLEQEKNPIVQLTFSKQSSEIQELQKKINNLQKMQMKSHKSKYCNQGGQYQFNSQQQQLWRNKQNIQKRKYQSMLKKYEENNILCGDLQQTGLFNYDEKMWDNTQIDLNYQNNIQNSNFIHNNKQINNNYINNTAIQKSQQYCSNLKMQSNTSSNKQNNQQSQQLQLENKNPIKQCKFKYINCNSISNSNLLQNYKKLFSDSLNKMPLYLTHSDDNDDTIKMEKSSQNNYIQQEQIQDQDTFQFSKIQREQRLIDRNKKVIQEIKLEDQKKKQSVSNEIDIIIKNIPKNYCTAFNSYIKNIDRKQLELLLNKYSISLTDFKHYSKKIITIPQIQTLISCLSSNQKKMVTEKSNKLKKLMRILTYKFLREESNSYFFNNQSLKYKKEFRYVKRHFIQLVCNPELYVGQKIQVDYYDDYENIIYNQCMEVQNSMSSSKDE